MRWKGVTGGSIETQTTWSKFYIKGKINAEQSLRLEAKNKSKRTGLRTSQPVNELGKLKFE